MSALNTSGTGQGYIAHTVQVYQGVPYEPRGQIWKSAKIELLFGQVYTGSPWNSMVRLVKQAATHVQVSWSEWSQWGRNGQGFCGRVWTAQGEKNPAAITLPGWFGKTAEAFCSGQTLKPKLFFFVSGDGQHSVRTWRVFEIKDFKCRFLKWWTLSWRTWDRLQRLWVQDKHWQGIDRRKRKFKIKHTDNQRGFFFPLLTDSSAWTSSRQLQSSTSAEQGRADASWMVLPPLRMDKVLKSSCQVWDSVHDTHTNTQT